MTLKSLRTLVLICFAIFSLASIQSCSESISPTEELSSESQTSRVRLVLVDAPGDYMEVNVEIVDIQYNSSEDDGGWKSFDREYPINVDLTELIADNTLLLSDEIIPSGMLKQIRLVLSDNNNIVIEGEPEPIDLDTPSAQQSGLKLKLDTELEPGFSYTFILDWDVDKSIVKAGNSGKYNLKPVINVIAEVNSGTVKGNVIGKLSISEADAVALENVTVGVFSVNDLDNSVSSTQTDVNGDFTFLGLAGGSYIFKIMNLGYQDYETPQDTPIVVEVGVVNVLGESIELLLSDSIKGNVVGKLTVDDENPIALENVTIEIFTSNDLVNALTTTITDINGDFSFQGLMTNSYVLKITNEGYNDYESTPIDVEFGVLYEIAESIELLLIE